MHLTVRMAWHDSNWNGHICRNPDTNTYCIGAHSLLSGRIEKNKNLDFEKSRKGAPLSRLRPVQIPPCHWSINAFGSQTFKIEQKHAFKEIKDKVPETVGPNSFYTWPFKLSFNHAKEKIEKYGNYPPDLEDRILGFANKFIPKESLVFFYANYDNPASADEMKYLLIGCSVLSTVPKRTWFPFSKEFIKEWSQRSTKLKHFPKINWALLCSHDPKSLVLLPYGEYLDYVGQNPEDEEKLDEVKVIIEENSLVRGFKYVAMDIDDDKCLYLLYKLRKSIKKIQEHNQLVVKSTFSDEEGKINRLIRMVWQKRGIYPSLGKVLNYFLDDEETSGQLATALCSLTDERKHSDLSSVSKRVVIDLKPPKQLKKYMNQLEDLAENRKFKKHYEALAKLSLLNLTPQQIKKIIENETLLKGIKTNPYALYERYESDEDDLDSTDLTDELIDVYKVDIGMIPDRKFVNRHQLQNLTEDSPERLRSVIINYLRSIGAQGHCYDTIDAITADIQQHPLIYKNDIKIDADAIRKPEDDYRTHFIENLVIKEHEGTQYYYLSEIKKAENQVKEWIESFLGRKDHTGIGFDYKKHIASSVAELKKRIPDFEVGLFRKEREKLYSNVFRKSLFLLTGKPGSGKTYETSKIVHALRTKGEGVVVLAPTGKAVLRLREVLDLKNDEHTVIETIDRFVYGRGFEWAYDDWEKADALADREKLTIENLVIDESSMVDLAKLKVLLSIFKHNQKYPKRVIMVGDENQLPPIGFGKPFSDIVTSILSKEKTAEQHYIHLTTNCRQENDSRIVKLADAFTDKHRYYEEALEIAHKEGKISDGLYIYKWRDRQELESCLLTATNSIADVELADELQTKTLNKVQKLNRLFGLYDNGNVNNKDFKFQSTLKLDTLQLLSPYRAGFFGTLGTNALIQRAYRDKRKDTESSTFYHSDKIIRLKNWYKWQTNRVDLLLSNGSIGVVKGDGHERQYYFPEHDYPIKYIDDEENFDLAYSITVHKSQGSDFRNVFLIIPNKHTLLSRELVYTALTRSRFRLFIFIQKGAKDLMLYARGISHVLSRQTSIFEAPEEKRRKYYPQKGAKPVQSKIEWIIFTALRNSGLRFEYEKPLKLKNLSYEIHPDFTVTLPTGETFYWEHLGMLDTRKYYRDWQERKDQYKRHGLLDNVITTDDLEGAKEEKLEEVLDNLRDRKLRRTPKNRFSNHHYELY